MPSSPEFNRSPVNRWTVAETTGHRPAPAQKMKGPAQRLAKRVLSVNVVAEAGYSRAVHLEPIEMSIC